MSRVITNEFLQYVPKHLLVEYQEASSKKLGSLTSCLREIIEPSANGKDALERIAMWYDSHEGRRYKDTYGKNVVITHAETLWNEYHSNPFSSI